MTKQECAERAVMYKHNGNNCAQAVVRALCDNYGIGQTELAKAAAGFGGGMGTTEGPCGALTGAVIMAGIRTDGVRTTLASKELTKSFTEKCGAVICKDLKGLDTGRVLCTCDNCVRNGVYSFFEVIEKTE